MKGPAGAQGLRVREVRYVSFVRWRRELLYACSALGKRLDAQSVDAECYPARALWEWNVRNGKGRLVDDSGF